MFEFDVLVLKSRQRFKCSGNVSPSSKFAIRIRNFNTLKKHTQTHTRDKTTILRIENNLKITIVI